MGQCEQEIVEGICELSGRNGLRTRSAHRFITAGGACVPVCPVSAIFALDDLPEKWAEFAEVNARHFKRDPVS